MEADTRERVFEPFFTTKPAGKGSGLGLSIVYNVARGSGGAVEVESEPGRGTVFRVVLPRAPAALQAAAGEAGGVRPVGGTETILVAEDQDAVRRLVCNVLRRAGYCVLAAADGEAALARAAEPDTPIHLLLTDVVMPRLGGGELARRLLDQRPELRVLFTSGHPEPIGAAPAHAPEPASLFLAKPFSEAELLAKVREVLDAPPAPAEPDPSA
jgi:CheY-like chemotaxis protein